MHCTEKEKTRSGNSGAFYCLRFAALFVEALRWCWRQHRRSCQAMGAQSGFLALNLNGQATSFVFRQKWRKLL
jgi:hypothetical protein